MSLLISFVGFLNNEERRLFEIMPLSGKEKALRDLVMIADNSSLTKAEMMKDLSLTSTHYDKIKTIVLKKAYRFIAGDDEIEQLNFLSKKFMFNHLFHEIKNLKAKSQISRIDNEKKEKYLRAFFDFSINVPAKYFDEKFVSENARDFLSSITQNKRVKEFEVKSKMLFARLNSLTQKCPSELVIENMKSEITALEKKYSAIKNPEAKSILYHSWVNYYRMLDHDWKKRTLYLEKIKSLYKDGDLPVFERAIYECHMAEMLFEKSEYSKAYLAYTKTFSMYMPLLRNQFHHFARWIELAMILGLYSDAEHLLDSLFRVYVKNRHESNGVLGSLLYAELYFLKGDYNTAYQNISLAKSLNSIKVYFIYEIRIRMREALFFSIIGDYKFVTRLSERSLRYIMLQKLSPARYNYSQFFKILKNASMIKSRYPNRLDVKMKRQLAEFRWGYDKLNGLLLEKFLSYKSPD